MVYEDDLQMCMVGNLMYCSNSEDNSEDMCLYGGAEGVLPAAARHVKMKSAAISTMVSALAVYVAYSL